MSTTYDPYSREGVERGYQNRLRKTAQLARDLVDAMIYTGGFSDEEAVTLAAGVLAGLGPERLPHAES